MNSKVITRFAPSPTGYLHVGGARTALFSWLLARHGGGEFLLRIEDTDLARSTEESVTGVLEDLRWLGLNWDNRELVYQSKRVAVYDRIINDLIARGMAYRAYETLEELAAQRRIADRAKRAYIYRRPNLTEEQIRKFEAEGRASVVRFVMPIKEYRFHDVVLGKEIVLAGNQVQDFVIRKTDGMPTYHFAVVVDDAEMGITHVLRGQEHLLNTVNHIGLQEALGYPRPIYGHLPVILNTDGSKMGKRDRDKKIRHHAHLWIKNTKNTPADLARMAEIPAERITWWLEDDGRQLEGAEHRKVMPVVGLKENDLPEILVHDFRANGYLPEVMLNFLALLGWSPGGDKERMSVKEIVELFSLDGIGKSNAKFNREKLLAFNTEACAAGPEDRLLAGMRDFLSVNPQSPMNRASDDQLRNVLKMNAGMRILREVEEKSRFLFVGDEEIEYQPEAIEKVLRKNDGQGLKALGEIREVLRGVVDWSAHGLEEAVKQFCEKSGLGLGKVAQPIRVAVSGTAVSPPIFETLAMLGKERTLRRIERAVALPAARP
ncbi:MAG TPA: glutamate--tRNA ligase [Tepidisphaeraceae bacterium]|jgi:glutamyl-tRNA synthetase|nr:glutamate--tRNA ligase [Tepidisphaeraceae bacterium]